MPAASANPLAPTRPGGPRTELPEGGYDVAVFDNLFPTLNASAEAPEPVPGVRVAPASGACEVVVFTQDPTSSLGRLSIDHLALVLEVWADRERELGAREDIRFVMPFENRGAEVGVTLMHPHGQIYAYAFVPPIPARKLALEAEHYAATGRGLVADLIAMELADGRRMLYESDEAVAFVPASARYPYEVWVAPRRQVGSLGGLSEEERRGLARALKSVLLRYDGLWSRPFPYLMVVHGHPTDGLDHPEAHLHIEFSPPYRSHDRLKYLAGTELGAGLFANDALPEAKAAELRGVEVHLE
jgi:UDPglucose--hexose-1-phosphate uridylyltransferase